MKKLLPLLLLFVSLKLSAQIYTPFDFENSEWYCAKSIEVHDINGPFYYYYDEKIAYVQDSIINGIAYKMLGEYSVHGTNPIFSNPNGQYYFLREDNKRVYAFYNYHGMPLDEYMLYDFNLQIGDSIELPDIYIGNQIPALKLKVINKDSINTQNGYRNSITLKYICPQFFNPDYYYTFNNDSTITWIEGMGSHMGLLYNTIQEETQGFEVFIDNSYLCFQLNDSIYYGGPCYYYTTDRDNTKPSNISIYPNPTDNNINLQLPQNLTKGFIQLYNATGGLVGTYPISKQIDVSALPNGIYYLRLQSEGAVYSQKVVIDR
jgi:hypothetical protein